MLEDVSNKIRALFKKYPLIKNSVYITFGVLIYEFTLKGLYSFEDVASTLASVTVLGSWYLYKFEKCFEENKEEIAYLKKQLLEASNTEQKLGYAIETLKSLNYKTISEQEKITKRVDFLEFSQKIEVCDSCQSPLSESEFLNYANDEDGDAIVMCNYCGPFSEPNLTNYIPISESIINISKRLIALEDSKPASN